jgi:hypothetical protein
VAWGRGKGGDIQCISTSLYLHDWHIALECSGTLTWIVHFICSSLHSTVLGSLLANWMAFPVHWIHQLMLQTTPVKQPPPPNSHPVPTTTPAMSNKQSSRGRGGVARDQVHFITCTANLAHHQLTLSFHAGKAGQLARRVQTTTEEKEEWRKQMIYVRTLWPNPRLQQQLLLAFQGLGMISEIHVIGNDPQYVCPTLCCSPCTTTHLFTHVIVQGLWNSGMLCWLSIACKTCPGWK